MEAEGSKTMLRGLYRSERKRFAYLRIEGEEVSYHEPGNSTPKRIEIHYGDFHPLPHKLAQISGKQHYNFKLKIFWNMNDPEIYVERFGVFSDDGGKIYYKSYTEEDGVVVVERITKEEADQIDAEEGDPISCPPGPYKIQPHHQGRLIWFTGAPGTGKSTTAQLLGRLHGFVYFEFDCWNRLRNPYIPLDVANPTLNQDLQRYLQGEGKAERLQVIADADKEYQECKKTGADLSTSQAVRRWVEMNSEDILRERRRIGGDWAIAGCLTHRSTRDTLRLCLGEDLLIVVLTMSEEDLRERLSLRHSGYQSLTDALMKVAKRCMDVEEDEENVLGIEISKSMTQEDVVELIMSRVDNFYADKKK